MRILIGRFIVTILGLFLLVGIIFYFHPSYQKIEKGQKWITSGILDTPFGRLKEDTLYVIDVENEWVLMRCGGEVRAMNSVELLNGFKLIK